MPRSRYNLRTRDKTFSVGESVLVLTPDSTSSKVFSRWKGPGVVREIMSKNSYMQWCIGGYTRVYGVYQPPGFFDSVYSPQ